MAKNLLVWLGEPFSDDIALVGQRSARLSELVKLGFPVPNGFILTTLAHKDFLEESNLQTKIQHLQASLTDEKIKKAVEEELARAQLPKHLTDEILKAYVKLVGHLQHMPLVLTSSLSMQPLVVTGEANLLIEIKNLLLELARQGQHDNVSFMVQLHVTPGIKGVIHSSLVDNITLLSQKEKLYLVELAQKAQKHFFFPQTLSWVFAKDTLYITDVKEFTPKEDYATPHTATKIYVTLSDPKMASEIAQQPIDGVGLLNGNELIKRIGIHPKKTIDEGKGKQFIEKLTEQIAVFTKAFSPRPVVYQTSNLATNEYRQLEGGKAYETLEQNPLLGYRGAYRYLDDPDIFHLELEAVKQVRNKLGMKNLWLSLPYVRTVSELRSVKSLIASSGLYRSPSFKIWIMIEIPSNVILLDAFIELGIDGVSINLDSLTRLLLGTDSANPQIIRGFDESDGSILWAVEHVIKSSHKHGVTVSLCGQASLYPSILKHIINNGITSISVTPDAIDSTRQHVSQFEKERANYGKN